MYRPNINPIKVSIRFFLNGTRQMDITHNMEEVKIQKRQEKQKKYI